MEIKRTNAFTMCYGPSELGRKWSYGTEYAMDYDMVSDDFHCCDVWIGETGKSEKYVLVSQYPLKKSISGAVILDIPIDFHGENQMSMKGIQLLDDVLLVSLERFLKQKLGGPVTTETADFYMAQGQREGRRT